MAAKFGAKIQPDLLQARLAAGRLEVGSELGQLGLVRKSRLIGVGGVEDEGDVLGQWTAAGERDEFGLEAALVESILENGPKE